MMAWFAFCLLGLLGLLFYLVPGMTANGLRVRKESLVWVINVFLGWTILGWVAALALAVALPREEEQS